MKGILYFVSLAALLSFRHPKLTAGVEGRVRILAIECVLFFSSYRFIIFSRSNAHIPTNKEGAKTREMSISGLKINVWLGAFI